MYNAQDLISRFKRRDIEQSEAFSILKALSYVINKSQESYDPVAQELVLRALDQKTIFSEHLEILNALARQQGLFPYLDKSKLGVRDAMAVAFHSPSTLFSTPKSDTSNSEFVFHRAQAEVFRRLMDGESIVLSAPTSFGKSSIVDALIESGKFSNLVIVVPTIALIDETRRRLSKYKETHKVITHQSQELHENNIFVFTQERVVDYPDFPDLDLFVLDEFYKLNPNADQERSATLNHAFYRLTKKAKQFYLLGPNIQKIPDGFSEKFKCKFIRTDFSTVVTELRPVKASPGQEENKLVELCRNLKEPTLIYCASPAKARSISEHLRKSGVLKTEKYPGMPAAADWIGENYHEDWSFPIGLRAGIGMHHGRMPRALAQLVVKGFNEKKIQFLVCTSTLIEGVNTKAKNIIIFDNKIAKKKYDYFTFNNIRGRSGRMFEHFIGHVYIFHDAPQEEFSFVDIPVYSQDESNTPESLIIQLEEKDLSKTSLSRVEQYKTQQMLSLEVIKSNIGIDPTQQLQLAEHFLENRRLLSDLAWSGFPSYEQLKLVCELIWQFFVSEKGRVGGVSSGSQLAFRLKKLRQLSIPELIQEDIDKGASPDDAVENLLDFMRQWPQYRFGRFAMGINRIQIALAPNLKPAADYSLYVSQVENLFSDPSLMALDEYGIPFPLAKKLELYLSSEGMLDGALEKLRKLNISRLALSNFEYEVITEAKKFI